MENLKVAWFSCGATSAVACKLALEKYPDLEILYIETGSHHPDNIRFIKDCEKWFKKDIKIIQSAYTSVFDVFRRTGFIHSAHYAPCTALLKTRVRQEFEYSNKIERYIWGFELGVKEELRAKKVEDRYPEFIHEFPLIEKRLTKKNCLAILKKNKIKVPAMYRLGYHNNNCIGCVKGGMGYWNKIRKDFPDVFNEMSKIEREIGHHALKECFLDELDPNRGRHEGELLPECGILCSMIFKED